jgi:hypothetical protein
VPPSLRAPTPTHTSARPLRTPAPAAADPRGNAARAAGSPGAEQADPWMSLLLDEHAAAEPERAPTAPAAPGRAAPTSGTPTSAAPESESATPEAAGVAGPGAEPVGAAAAAPPAAPAPPTGPPAAAPAPGQLGGAPLAGGGGATTLDQLAIDVALADQWSLLGPETRTVPLVPLGSAPLAGAPAQTPLGPLTGADGQVALQSACTSQQPLSVQDRANQAVVNGLKSGGVDALVGVGMELGGTFLAKAGPTLAARSGTMLGRVAGASLGSAVPIVGGVFAAVDLVHQLSTIGDKPWSDALSDPIAALDCLGAVLQIAGDVLGIVSGVLAVAGVISAIAGVGFAIGGLAVTLGMVGLAISALGMLVQGGAAFLRYQRLVEQQVDPSTIEAELAALEQNVQLATGEAGNLTSAGLTHVAERRIDTRTRVDAAQLQRPSTTSPVSGVPHASNPGGGPLPTQAASTFASQTYTSGTLASDAYTTRLFGLSTDRHQRRSGLSNVLEGMHHGPGHYTPGTGSNGAAPTGSFLGHQVPQSLDHGRQISALPPEWNSGAALSVVKVEAGSTYHQGDIAPVATPSGGVPTAFPFGAPSGATGHYQGGGVQGYQPRGKDGFDDQQIVDVMPFDPQIGGWRPRLRNSLSSSIAGVDAADSLPEPSELCVPEQPASSTLDWSSTLQAGLLEAPPTAASLSLEGIAAAPADPAAIAARLPVIGRLSASAFLADAAAATSEAWVSEYDRALGAEGPYGQLQAELDAQRAQLDTQQQATDARDAAVAESEAGVQEQEARQAEAQGEQGAIGSGGGAVGTVVSIAANPAVRGLVSIGTGIGGAVISGVNAVGSLFGADEPVIDPAVLDGVKNLMDQAPALDRSFNQVNGESGAASEMASAPRRTVDEQAGRVQTVAAGNEGVAGELTAQQAALDAARAQVEADREAALTEGTTAAAAAEADLAARDELNNQVTAEAGALEAWSAGARAARGRNLQQLAAGRAATAAPTLSPTQQAAADQARSQLSLLEAHLTGNLASLESLALLRKASGEASNRRPYPSEYTARVQGAVQAGRERVHGAWVPVLRQARADLDRATPDQLDAVLAAIERLCAVVRDEASALFGWGGAVVSEVYGVLPASEVPA